MTDPIDTTNHYLLTCLKRPEEERERIVALNLHAIVHAFREGLQLRRLRRDLARLDVTPLELCKGEAHDNVFADHCAHCMPRWGYVRTWIVIGEGQKR